MKTCTYIKRLSSYTTQKKIVTFPFNAEKKGVSLMGDVGIGTFVHGSGNIKNNSFNFYVQPIIDISAQSKVGITYNPNIYQDIDQYPILKLKNIVKGVVQCGPVTLRPYVDVETYVDFGASGTVDMSFGKTFSAKIGYSQQDGAYIKNTTSGVQENKFIKSVSIDGNVSIGFKCLFDVGCGLYTKNIALALDPYFEYLLGADCRLSGNENGWHSSPKINFDINVGADGRLAVNWFHGIKMSPTLKFFDTNLYHKEWSVLPIIDENNFSVKHDDSSEPLIFDAKYDITGGLLSMFDNIYPGIAIYKENELIYKKTFSKETKYNQKQNVNFKLDGLKENTTYTAKPTITANGVEQELDGVPFVILKGTWRRSYNDGGTVSEKFCFFADGTCNYEEIVNDVQSKFREYANGTYSIVGKKLTLRLNFNHGLKETWSYNIKSIGEKLVLMDEDGDTYSYYYYKE